MTDYKERSEDFYEEVLCKIEQHLEVGLGELTDGFISIEPRYYHEGYEGYGTIVAVGLKDGLATIQVEQEEDPEDVFYPLTDLSLKKLIFIERLLAHEVR